MAASRRVGKFWIATLAAALDARVRRQVSLIFWGLLFARDRRMVTSWLRAIGMRRHYEDRYYLLGSLGRKCEGVAAGRWSPTIRAYVQCQTKRAA